MTLRPVLHTKILEALDSSGFVASDFALTTQEGGHGTTLRIAFFYDSSVLKALIPNKPTKDTGRCDINLTVRPGRINIEEVSIIDGDHELLGAIQSWTQRIREDISRSPLARDLNNVERDIQEIYKKVGLTKENEDEPLNPEHAKSIVDWIKSIEDTMSANLAAAETDKKKLQSKLDELHAQVEALRTIVSSLPTKKSAMRAIMGRFLHWSAKPENNSMLKDGAKVVAGLLSDGGHKH